jgi:MFS family permease
VHPDRRLRVDWVAEHFSTADHIFLSLLWFAFFAQWLTIIPVIVPDQVATILGGNGTNKEGISGTIVAAGALVALVVAPFAGALSDRLRSVHGRRRPFLIAGVLGSCVGLGLLLPFRPGSSLVLYGMAILNLQFWWNWAAGPYAGLVSDIVSERDQGTASAWINIMSIAGSVVGNILIAIFYKSSRIIQILVILVGINLICLLITLARVRERSSVRDAGLIASQGLLQSFYIDPTIHANFYWVLITRLFAQLGIWSIFTFLLFYLRDVIGVPQAEAPNILTALLAAGAVIAIPASLVGVRAADRYGTVKVVQSTGWIMTAAALCYVFIAIRPELMLVVPVVVVFSAAYGAYLAVDWALALKVLPNSSAAGKDMGVWHISMVLPQVVGPAVSGWLISGLISAVSAKFAYSVVFGIAVVWLALASILVRRVRF